MGKINLLPSLALALAAGLLAACSSTSITDSIPAVAGGLPTSVPERPAIQPEYPAVNAMPQRREALPLTDNEIKSTKAELNNLRQQQEERAGTLPKAVAAPDNKKGAAPAKTAKKSKDVPKAAAELTAPKEQAK